MNTLKSILVVLITLSIVLLVSLAIVEKEWVMVGLFGLLLAIDLALNIRALRHRHDKVAWVTNRDPKLNAAESYLLIRIAGRPTLMLTYNDYERAVHRALSNPEDETLDETTAP